MVTRGLQGFCKACRGGLAFEKPFGGSWGETFWGVESKVYLGLCSRVLGGSWDLVSRVISKVSIVIST